MNRLVTVLIVCAALLLMVTSVYADAVKEKELQMRYEATDVDPMIGPLAPTTTIDDQWDMLADYMQQSVRLGAEEWNLRITVPGDSTAHHADFNLAELAG